MIQIELKAYNIIIYLVFLYLLRNLSKINEKIKIIKNKGRNLASGEKSAFVNISLILKKNQKNDNNIIEAY